MAAYTPAGMLAAVTAIAPAFKFDTTKRGVTSPHRLEFLWDSDAFLLPLGGLPSSVLPGRETELIAHLGEMLTQEPPEGCRILVELYRLQWSLRTEAEGTVIVAIRLLAPDEVQASDLPPLAV